MFDVLMYLFETYIHTEAELRVDQDKLEQDLTDAGFDREDIYNALLWLEKLADYQEGLAEPMQLASDPLSMRIYTPEECERLDASCRGFLLSLSKFRCLTLKPVNGDRASARAGYRRVRPGRPEMGNPDGVVQYSGLRKCVPANGRITL